MGNQNPDSLSLLDILAFLVRWRRVWIPSMLIAGIVVGIYAFTATPHYRSTAIIRGVENKSSGFGSLLASKLAGLGNLGGFAASMGEVRGDYYLMILRERSMGEKVVEKFGLRERLKMKNSPIEDVLEAWRGRVYFKHESSTSTVHIQVDDTDPRFAQEIANFYISELDSRLRDLESLKARKEREFAGSRLEEARVTLYALEDSMSSFQRRSGIINLEEQAKATVQAAAAVQAERLLARADYELKLKLFTSENPELNMARLKMAGLDSSLSYLNSHPNSSAERDFLLRFDSATEDGKTYLRLYRDIELYSLLMAVLTQQFEQARMEEARNTPALAVVEPASIGTKRVAPKRTVLIGLGLAGGLIIGLLGAGLVSTISRISAPDNPNNSKFEHLKRSWGG